jgi:uncharacterized membrane protein YcaP (DUF421 family)
MTSVLHSAVVYLLLLVVFRIAGKRTLSEITTFDFVLLLIISEGVQQALIGQDDSLTNAMLIVTTLVVLDVGFSLLKRSFPRVERLVDPSPVLIVADGVFLKDVAAKERVGMDDVLSAARCLHGLERLEQVKHAVLETGGKISIIPRDP